MCFDNADDIDGDSIDEDADSIADSTDSSRQYREFVASLASSTGKGTAGVPASGGCTDGDGSNDVILALLQDDFYNETTLVEPIADTLEWVTDDYKPTPTQSRYFSPLFAFIYSKVIVMLFIIGSLVNNM